MNYPGGVKKEINSTQNTRKKNINYKNRGMTLENELNSSNEFYKEMGIAYIYKKPTPIKVTKVDYPSRDKAVIREAFYTIPSTTDYNGIYQGKYIDFEAKETQSKTSFALENIHKHQLKHIENIYNSSGIAFLIVRFTSLNETYLLPAKNLLDFLNNTTRKSIPIDFFRKNAYQIKDNYRPTIDYLKIVNKLIGGK